MSIGEVEKAALALPEHERVRLAVALLETLPLLEQDLTDEAVLQRDAELENGRAEEISHDEFIQRVERDRGR